MSDVVAEVKGHGEKVVTRQVERPGGCPKCERRGGSFQFHEAKLRFFLVVVVRLVTRVKTHLARWKCPHCGRTFIAYPDFAVPHKHYVRQEVEGRPRTYVEGESDTYKEAASEGGMPINYEGKAGEDEGRQMSPSTVWRWVGFIAALDRLLRRALRHLVYEASARTVSLSVRKCRNGGREDVLRRCLTVLRGAAEYRRLFGMSIFSPRFGIGGLSG